ncbi:MAG: tripartite tricarboxylate transporter substrate binding protein [Burkholderiales bacterium]|nr:tripartite tricarboxylate transporter substrate binding protein [Burkholderiales bacterium]
MKKLGAFALSICIAGAALAAYPERAITIVVPTAPGGGNDVMARTVGQKMSALLGQPVIVENKAGANGAIASEFVARAPADGYTLMLGYVATHAMNPALQKLRYDPVADFAPIGLIATSQTLMVANTKAGIQGAQDLVAQLRAKPDKFAYASAGNGTAPHFAAELFKISTGVSMLGVPYKGAAPAVTDTISGQTQVMFPSLFTALPFVKSGQLKAIGVAGPKRSPLLPDVPTLKEQGIEGVDVQQWYGLFAPARTPPEIVNALNKALRQALADKEIARRLAAHGADAESSTPAQFGELVKTELAKWRGVVQRAQIRVD